MLKRTTRGYGSESSLRTSVAPDGKRFVVLMSADNPEQRETQSHVMLVVNFFDEVRRAAWRRNGLFKHHKGGFYHDGRFPDLRTLVDHYDVVLNTALSDSEKEDMIAYLLTL